MSVTDKALSLAADFIPVFSVRSNKHPCTERGHLDASMFEDAVARMFADPAAALIGMPTGLASGISVIDIDPDHDGTAWYVENAHRLPATRIHRTRRNGFHILFNHRAGVRCSAGQLAPGVDIRGDGGYIVRWDQADIPLESDAPIADMPDWLADDIAACRTREHLALDGPPVPQPEAWDEAELARVRSGIERRLNEAANGTKHSTLCRESVLMGGILYATGMDETEAAHWLVDCLPPVDDAEAAYDTAMSGIVKGTRAPVPLESPLAGLGPLPDEDPSVSPRGASGATAPVFYRDDEDPYGSIGWLVYQMLPERGVAQMAGVSRAGKTFTAIDLALSVTTGVAFAGQEIDRTGGVLWLAAEGSAEVTKRWRAAKAARGFAGKRLPFLWRDALPCKLCADGAAAKYAALAKAAKAELQREGSDLVLIIVDTMAAAAGWESENDNAQAQDAMDLLQGLSIATGALVLAIDHHGKSLAAGTRGASAKDANADARLVIMADEDSNGKMSNRRMIVSKCRGGPEGEIRPFNLATETVGEDAKGRPITTCTIEWLDKSAIRASAKASAGADMRPSAVAQYNALMNLLATTPGATTRDAWYAECVRTGLCDATPPDATRPERERIVKAFRTRLSDLKIAGWIGVDGEIVTDLRTAEAGPDISVAELLGFT